MRKDIITKMRKDIHFSGLRKMVPVKTDIPAGKNCSRNNRRIDISKYKRLLFLSFFKIHTIV